MVRIGAAGRMRMGVALLLAILAVSLWHLHVMNRWMAGRSDLIQPWTGAQVALAGHDPYSEAVTEEIQRRFYGHALAPAEKKDRQAFAYPIYTAFLLAPLTRLPWNGVRAIYLILAAVGLGASVPFWLRCAGLEVSRRRALLLTGFALVSWPALVALRHQQLTLVVAVFGAAACFLLVRGKDIPSGAVLAITLIKPQFAMLLVGWLFVWGLVQGRRRFVGSLVASCCVLLGASEVLLRGWFSDWLGVVRAYSAYTRSGEAFLMFIDHRVGVAALAAVALLGGAALWRARNALAGSTEFGEAIGLALALPVALVPTSPHWIYNQVLLLPGCLMLIRTKPGRLDVNIARIAALICLAWGFVAVPVAVLAETVQRPGMLWDFLPYLNPGLPVFLSLALALQTLVSRVRAAAEDSERKAGSLPAVQAAAIAEPASSR